MTPALEYIFGRYSNVPPFFFQNMYKFLTYIFVVTALFATSVANVHAQEISDSSAVLKTEFQDNSFDYRVKNLTNFLARYNSPLASYASDFVNFADQYGLDYRLVPAISGTESTFGKHIPYKSFNAYGWANGEYKFTSWPNSIQIVSSTLREKYIDKGAPTISKIARRYAPPSTTWGGHVKYFVGKIDVLPLTFDI